MELNKEQRAAVEYITGPLLVIAGPGTGKTQILSKRVAYILEQTDTAPENILCLTFTDSGAENMRQRIRRLVGPEGAKVLVSTYHGFGGEILAQYKDYSTTYTKRMENVVEGVAQFKIVKEIMDKLPGTDILRGDKVKDVLQVIGEARAARLTPDDLRLIADENMKDVKILTNAMPQYFHQIVKGKFAGSYENAYLPAWRDLKPAVNLPLIMPKVERYIVEVARALGEAIAEAGMTGKITPLSNWKKAYFELDGAGRWRTKGRVKNLKLKSIATVYEKYINYLHENGLYDFNDMIEDAINALKNDDGFKLTLAERYQYIMLDEFQDTNPAQLEIVKLITDYEQPNVMAVGDDDQGIYAFQGALASNMRDFSEYYGAHEITLKKNYRSTKDILDYAAGVMEQATDRYVEKTLEPVRVAPSTPQVERREFASSDAEYAFVAHRISELVRSGVNQSDIAVLSYKSKYFQPLLPFLREYPEIRIAYEKQDNLLEDPKIHEIMQIARFVCDYAAGNRSDVSLTEIMGYQFFDLPLIEVIGLAERAKTERRNVFEALGAAKNPEITTVAEFLTALIAKSLEEPYEVVLEYIIGARELNGYRSRFLEYYGECEGDYASFRLYDNLSCIRERMRSYYGEKSLKLRDFIAMVDDYDTAGEMISTTSPYREADSAVQIMTAHKAKGLEFAYVFILSADSNAWGKGGGNHDTTSLPSNVTFIHHTGMTDGERIRILYVALTRARDHLIITNAKRDYSGKPRKRLEYLKEEDADGAVVGEFLPGRVVIVEPEVTDVRLLAQNAKDWFSRYLEPEANLRSYFLGKAERLQLSASSVFSFINVVFAGPKEFVKTYLMPRVADVETESMVYGTLVHKTFERVTNTLASDEAAVDFFLEELERTRLSSDERSKLADKGPVALKTALAKFRPIIEHGKAEVDFAADKLVLDGVRITGKIDHITIDEEKKVIEVYDFKTTKYADRKWESDARSFDYALQLTFYKLLLNLSPRFSRYRVAKGHILYVNPDDDGLVYDRTYEYDVAKMEWLKTLIRAVHYQLEDLKFLDDPEVYIDADGGKGLNDVKAFSQLIIDKME